MLIVFDIKFYDSKHQIHVQELEDRRESFKINFKDILSEMFNCLETSRKKKLRASTNVRVDSVHSLL